MMDYLTLRLGGCEHEVFGLIYLDVRFRLIKVEDMFRGSHCEAKVYPREVVKAALGCNADGIVCFHNHPSGSTEPSASDKLLTVNLKAALELVGIQLFDHWIIQSIRFSPLGSKVFCRQFRAGWRRSPPALVAALHCFLLLTGPRGSPRVLRTCRSVTCRRASLPHRFDPSRGARDARGLSAGCAPLTDRIGVALRARAIRPNQLELKLCTQHRTTTHSFTNAA